MRAILTMIDPDTFIIDLEQWEGEMILVHLELNQESYRRHRAELFFCFLFHGELPSVFKFSVLVVKGVLIMVSYSVHGVLSRFS